MFDYNTAEEAVLELLAKTEREMGELKIRFSISEVIEQDFGWVFLYEAHDRIKADCAPLIFDKSDGLVYVADKASTLQHALEQYRSGIKTRA